MHGMILAVTIFVLHNCFLCLILFIVFGVILFILLYDIYKTRKYNKPTQIIWAIKHAVAQ